MKNLIAAIIVVVVFSCTDEGRSADVLYKAGYKNVVIDGHGWGCSDDDAYCTAFHATGPSGYHVNGVVGCGHDNGCDKGCTIRIK